jgi:hypothetical protein
MFIDTDVILSTPITPGVLFDEQWRPRVKALLDRRPNMGYFWSRMPSNTQQWLGGLPEPMRAMAFFPIVIRTEDFAHMRNHIEMVNGGHFNDIFQQLACPFKFSQFNIMAGILFYTRRDAYAWSFHRYAPNNETELPGQLTSWSYAQLLNEDNTRPLVSGSLHMPYLSKALKNRTAVDFIREGFCSLTHDTTMCDPVNEYELRASFFEYDGGLWTWDPRVETVQREYEEEVKKFGYSFSKAQRELVKSFDDK